MEISKLVEEYLIRFPDERKSLKGLLHLIKRSPKDKDLINRKAFRGHITASAIIVCRKTSKMLKIYNESLEMYLQPGGHITSVKEGPLNAAKRFLTNTGISEFPVFIPIGINELVPLDIDTHNIPAIKKEGEPKHIHHDFRYLFTCTDEFHVEGKDYKWEDIATLKRENTFADLIDKVQLLWSKEFGEKQFYSSIVANIVTNSSPNFIVVQHFLPGVDHFLESLESIGKVAAIIPKPKSIDEKIIKRLKRYYRIVRMNSREELESNSEITDIIKKSGSPIVLIDIGGWFAPHLKKWTKDFPGKIIGVVEDTENGHQKYKALPSIPLPIVSVARSPLKNNEDILIGQSISFSANSILRTQNKLIKYLKCGVIGYGKIGKSIASDLTINSIKPTVFDNDPLKLIAAYNDGCSIDNRRALLSTCDVIFCATGNRSIQTLDIPDIKRGCYLFSVTSADDEFNFSDIDANYQFEVVTEHIKRYYKFESSFYLANDGNAVNFIHKAVVGDFIHLVKAEMLMAAAYLLNNKHLQKGVLSLPKSNRKRIADIWLNCFQKI